MSRASPERKKKKDLMIMGKTQLIDHIFELQQYVAYSKATNFYANHAAEMPYRSLYSQTLIASEKLLAKLHKMPITTQSPEITASHNAKQSESNAPFLATSPIKKIKKKQPAYAPCVPSTPRTQEANNGVVNNRKKKYTNAHMNNRIKFRKFNLKFFIFPGP
jgi:hypothetical protein